MLTKIKQGYYLLSIT